MGVKVGIIGCGRWGTVHLNTLNSLKKIGTVSEIHACDLIPSKEVDLTGLIDSFCANWQTMVESVRIRREIGIPIDQWYIDNGY